MSSEDLCRDGPESHGALPPELKLILRSIMEPVVTSPADLVNPRVRRILPLGLLLILFCPANGDGPPRCSSRGSECLGRQDFKVVFRRLKTPDICSLPASKWYRGPSECARSEPSGGHR